MKNTLIQEIRKTPNAMVYVAGALLFLIFGLASSFIDLGMSALETYTSGSIVIGLGLLALFTYQISHQSFIDIREQSSKIGLTFMIIITFSIAISSEKEDLDYNYFILPACSYLLPYIITFVIKLLITPHITEK
jgi:hypothetical protein